MAELPPETLEALANDPKSYLKSFLETATQQLSNMATMKGIVMQGSAGFPPGQQKDLAAMQIEAMDKYTDYMTRVRDLITNDPPTTHDAQFERAKAAFQLMHEGGTAMEAEKERQKQKFGDNTNIQLQVAQNPQAAAPTAAGLAAIQAQQLKQSNAGTPPSTATTAPSLGGNDAMLKAQNQIDDLNNAVNDPENSSLEAISAKTGSLLESVAALQLASGGPQASAAAANALAAAGLAPSTTSTSEGDATSTNNSPATGYVEATTVAQKLGFWRPNWKLRFFTLTGNTVSYFANEAAVSGKPKGTFWLTAETKVQAVQSHDVRKDNCGQGGNSPVGVKVNVLEIADAAYGDKRTPRTFYLSFELKEDRVAFQEALENNVKFLIANPSDE